MAPSGPEAETYDVSNDVPAPDGHSSALAGQTSIPTPDSPTIRVKVQTAHGQPGAMAALDSTVTGDSARFGSSKRSASTDTRGSAHDKDSLGPVADVPLPVTASAVATDDAQPIPLETVAAALTSTVPSTSVNSTSPSILTTPASDLMTMSATPTPPVSQITRALLTLSTGSDGTQQITLRLQPEELGTVEVRIDRALDGSTSVSMTADNPDTLQMLTGAQSDLHKALDAAGIPADRALTFSLAQESRPPPGLADLPSQPIGGDSSTKQYPSGDGTGNASSQGGSTSGNASGDMAGGRSSGSTGDDPAGGSRDGRRGWANFSPTFQTAGDQTENDMSIKTE